MNRHVSNLIGTLFIVIYLLVWVLSCSANSGLVKVESTKPTAAMELFGHPDSGTTAITPVAAATEICFPHFADGPSWWTGIAVANPGNAPALVTMRAYSDSGEQIGYDFTQIIPSQSQMAPAVMQTLFSLAGTETGWIKLTSTQPVVALEIFGHTDSGGIAGFSPAAASTEIYIPHFAEDKDWWTGISVANPGTHASQVSIIAFSDTGQQIGDTYQELIGAGCRMTPQIVRNLVSLGGYTSGWLKIAASQPVVAMEIFGQVSTSMIAGLSAGEMGAKLYYPYFQEGSGKWTGIAIANPGATEARVTFKALNNDGDTVGVVNDQRIPASGRMTPQTITGLFGSLGIQTGYLEVTSNQPIIGLGLLGGTGWLASYTAVKEQIRALVFPHFADSSGWWTKLALVNCSDDTATLSMAAYGVTGTLVGEEKNVALGPFATVVENLPFSNSDVDPVAESTKTIGILGGILTVTNALGDVISLEIPIGALQEDTEITLSSLNVSLSDPIAKNVFPGVKILPDGTTFLVPAKLKVVFVKPLDNEAIAVLYQVKTAEFIVPLDDLVVTETSIEGYISHLSDYGGGEPTSAEAQAQLEIALGQIPMSGSSNYSESLEAVSYALAICEEMLLKGGDDSCENEVAMRVLKEVQDFLKRPRPEPPCEHDYKNEAYSYWRMMAMIGLPEFDDPLLTAAAEAVRQQIHEVVEEILRRCEHQIILYICEVIVTDVMTIEYNGEMNLGWDAHGFGGDPASVDGRATIPIIGSGGFGTVDYTAGGIWALLVTKGSMNLITSENGIQSLQLNLEINGHVAQWMTACTDKGCVENESDYEKDATWEITMSGATHTQVMVESFDGGYSVTTLTADMVGDPKAQ